MQFLQIEASCCSFVGGSLDGGFLLLGFLPSADVVNVGAADDDVDGREALDLGERALLIGGNIVVVARDGVAVDGIHALDGRAELKLNGSAVERVLAVVVVIAGVAVSRDLARLASSNRGPLSIELDASTIERMLTIVVVIASIAISGDLTGLASGDRRPLGIELNAGTIQRMLTIVVMIAGIAISRHLTRLASSDGRPSELNGLCGGEQGSDNESFHFIISKIKRNFL